MAGGHCRWKGRPTNALQLSLVHRNSYSLYCAELMANMKDVPSTERMVLCSQQWKLLSQKEKDAYHKKCDQVSELGAGTGVGVGRKGRSGTQKGLGLKTPSPRAGGQLLLAAKL